MTSDPFEFCIYALHISDLQYLLFISHFTNCTDTKYCFSKCFWDSLWLVREDSKKRNKMVSPCMGLALLKLISSTPGSSSGQVKEILTEAAKLVAAEGTDHDLETAPDRDPKWSSHSLRRLADTVARRHREAMGVSEAEIDIYFGWHERVLLKEMQVHYEALSPRERMLHAKITGMM